MTAPVARLVRESASFRVLVRLEGLARRLIGGSSVVAATRSWRDRFMRLEAPVRMRLVGVFLICASLTNAALLLVLPGQMAPEPPFAMPILAGTVAILLIVRSSR
jgi:hypothetical protein